MKKRLKKWFKPIIIIIGWCAVIAYLFTGLFQKHVAVTSGCIHSIINHPEKGLLIVSSVEYVPVIGSYVVTFTDKDGWYVIMRMGPDFFPINVEKSSLWPDI